jgi:hypothetical protein
MDAAIGAVMTYQTLVTIRVLGGIPAAFLK